jgi:hypothetical protein
MRFLRLAVGACIIILTFDSCRQPNTESEVLNQFNNYYSAVKSRSEDKWNFMTDTVKLWFDEKTGDPILQTRNNQKQGPWAEWDKEMNASSFYDSIWYDKTKQTVQGYFYENNDFYEMIGKSPTKTLRTYWINENNKINEILIYWIPEENTTSSEHLGPIVDWAMKNDSLEIQTLYPEGNIIPSKENAKRWKLLLTKYKESIN